jgi:hypothetical protein
MFEGTGEGKAPPNSSWGLRKVPDTPRGRLGDKEEILARPVKEGVSPSLGPTSSTEVGGNTILTGGARPKAPPQTMRSDRGTWECRPCLGTAGSSKMLQLKAKDSSRGGPLREFSEAVRNEGEFDKESHW